MIRLQHFGNSSYKVFHENGVFVGEFFTKEDGYYDFWPTSTGGYWSQDFLLAIANKLQELNAPWDKHLEEFFDEQKTKEA